MASNGRSPRICARATGLPSRIRLGQLPRSPCGTGAFGRARSGRRRRAAGLRHGPGAGPRRARAGGHQSRAKPDRGRVVGGTRRGIARAVGAAGPTSCSWSKTTTARAFPAYRCTPWPARPRSGRSSARRPRRTALICGSPSSPATTAPSSGCTGGCGSAGWVSHLLQGLAVGLWSDQAAVALVATAERRYAASRERLCDALAECGRRRTDAPGSTCGFRFPTRTVAITRLLGAGWAAAPGSRFRMQHARGHSHHHRRPDSR